MSYRLAHQRLSGPVKGFIQFSGSDIRGGPLGPTIWTLIGRVEGDFPLSFLAQPAEFNFRELDHLNGEFIGYIAGGTVTITYLEYPGTTIVGPAPAGSYKIRGKTKVIYIK